MNDLIAQLVSGAMTAAIGFAAAYALARRERSCIINVVNGGGDDHAKVSL